jgi:putative DNA primase/helicase
MSEAVRELVRNAPVVNPTTDPRPEPPLQEASKPPRRFKLLSMAELRAMPAMSWRIHGVLQAEGYGALYGPSGSGKGFLLVDMIAAVREGRRWFGYRVKPARVLYVVLEGKAGIPKRFAAWEQVNERPFPDGVHFLFESFRLTERADVLGLAAAIETAGGAELIVIDTLNRAAPGADENSPQDMGRVLESVKELQAMTGGMVLLVHHTGKDASKGMRGHSSLFGGMDAVIEVTRSGESRSWSNGKQKEEKDGESHPFQLRRVTLGEDEDGEPITSCVLESRVPLDADPPRPKLPKGGNQKIVYDALGPLFRESKAWGRGGAPTHRPCLTLDEAIAGTRDRLTVEPKRRTERAQQAITGLVATGVLGANEGWLWLI